MSKIIGVVILFIALVGITIGFFGGVFRSNEPVVAEHKAPVLAESQQTAVVEPAAPAEDRYAERSSSRRHTRVRSASQTVTASAAPQRISRRVYRPRPKTTATANAAGEAGSELAATDARPSEWQKIPGTGVGLWPKK